MSAPWGREERCRALIPTDHRRPRPPAATRIRERNRRWTSVGVPWSDAEPDEPEDGFLGRVDRGRGLRLRPWRAAHARRVPEACCRRAAGRRTARLHPECGGLRPSRRLVRPRRPLPLRLAPAGAAAGQQPEALLQLVRGQRHPPRRRRGPLDPADGRPDGHRLCPRSRMCLRRGPVGWWGDGRGDARHLPRSLRRGRHHRRRALRRREQRPPARPAMAGRLDKRPAGGGRRGARRLTAPWAVASGLDLARRRRPLRAPSQRRTAAGAVDRPPRSRRRTCAGGAARRLPAPRVARPGAARRWWKAMSSPASGTARRSARARAPAAAASPGRPPSMSASPPPLASSSSGAWRRGAEATDATPCTSKPGG